VVVGFGVVVVVVFIVGYGWLLWIVLLFAVSFVMYGLMKKCVGVNVGVVVSLIIEMVLLFLFVVVVLVWLEVIGCGMMIVDVLWYGLLFVLMGVVIVLSLLFFVVLVCWCL